MYTGRDPHQNLPNDQNEGGGGGGGGGKGILNNVEKTADLLMRDIPISSDANNTSDTSNASNASGGNASNASNASK